MGLPGGLGELGDFGESAFLGRDGGKMAENEYLDSSKEDYVNLYGRSRGEWLAFVTKAKLNGCKWANLIDLPTQAA